MKDKVWIRDINEDASCSRSERKSSYFSVIDNVFTLMMTLMSMKAIGMY